MAGSFDVTLKQLLDACAPDWVAWLAPFVGLPPDVQAEPIETELSTVQPAADEVFRLREPHTGLLHLEPQSSWDGTFPDRLLLYNVLLGDRYGIPVDTIAVLLRREANSSVLTGELVRRNVRGREYLRFEYAVVRVWELAADPLMAAGLGAAPLALLTDDGAPRLPNLVSRFAERVENEAESPTDASLLLSCAYILLGLRYDEAVAKALFHGVQKMRESSTYQAILSEGRMEGRAEGWTEGLVLARQEDLLALLQERFKTVPPEIEARIRSTKDAARLQGAIRQVLHINSPDDLTL